MERLTSARCNGIKSGYWSAAKKDVVVQRLGQYEATGLSPEEVRTNCIHWINAKHRAPLSGTPALVIVSGCPKSNITLSDAYMLAIYDARCGWIIEMYPEWKDADVSWWAELPDQPAEVDHV